MWRCRIPLRVRIHSSVVSRRAARSSFVTMVVGRAWPMPAITAQGLVIGLQEADEVHAGRYEGDGYARRGPCRRAGPVSVPPPGVLRTRPAPGAASTPSPRRARRYAADRVTSAGWW